jgi:hypothetical protein
MGCLDNSIVRMLQNIPIRLVASFTVTTMIERTYSRFITEHSDDIHVARCCNTNRKSVTTSLFGELTLSIVWN